MNYMGTSSKQPIIIQEYGHKMQSRRPLLVRLFEDEEDRRRIGEAILQCG